MLGRSHVTTKKQYAQVGVLALAGYLANPMSTTKHMQEHEWSQQPAFWLLQLTLSCTHQRPAHVAGLQNKCHLFSQF